MPGKARKIGILTGGGDCPGLNAVIRAIVKTAVNDYKMQVFGFEDGFKGLVENQYRELTPDIVAGILPKGGTILGTTNRDNPFEYPLEQNGKTEKLDMSGKVLENLKTLEIDALIVIGGDGSLSIAYELQKRRGINVVGVPKTIDNDLSATEVTFGFNTAVVTATEALDKLHTTAESHHRVMILEVMGRYAGWIALESGLAGGADVILIPEIPFNIEKICDKVRERYEAGKKFSIVVVSEGAFPEGGEMVVKKTVANSHDPVRLGGIGNAIGDAIERITGMETRVTVLGHLQRGGMPSAFDRILATRYGVAAARCVFRGQYGTMVSLRTPDIVTVPLMDAVGEIKKVSVNSDLISTAKAVGVSFGV
ncbi:MAG: 6-phosphofructokinase [Acidobacteriota bacterium]